MKKNSTRICGRNTTTDPTPAHTPSTSRSRGAPAGTTVSAHRPALPISASTPSDSGAAAVKMLWNTASTTPRKTSGPATGWRNTASSRRVHAGATGGRYDDRSAMRPAHNRQAGMFWSTGSSVRAGTAKRPARNWRTVSSPRPWPR
jgi:hypothetical protein